MMRLSLKWKGQDITRQSSVPVGVYSRMMDRVGVYSRMMDRADLQALVR